MARTMPCSCTAPGPRMPELRPFLHASEEPQPRGQREYGLEGSSPTSSVGTSLVSSPRGDLLWGCVLPGGWSRAWTRLSYLLVLHYAFRASALSLAKLWSLLGLCPQWWSPSPQAFMTHDPGLERGTGFAQWVGKQSPPGQSHTGWLTCLLPGWAPTPVASPQQYAR